VGAGAPTEEEASWRVPVSAEGGGLPSAEGVQTAEAAAVDSAAADLEAAERSLNESFLRLVWSAWQLVRMSAGLLCMEQ